MVKPILGGPGPTIKLFHYGAAIQGSVRKDSFWTDFESTKRTTSLGSPGSRRCTSRFAAWCL